MTRLETFIYGMAIAMSCNSCVRDELDDCPPLTVSIEVKDKNYANVDKIELEEPVDENLPFKDYVPSLYYRLSRLNDNGKMQMVAEKGVSGVEGEEQKLSVTFDKDLPFGKYVFTAWGGMPDLEEFNADRTEVSFHPEYTQGYDVYLASDTLDYDVNHSDFVSQMRRTKGKLIILAENIPRRFQFSGKTIGGLYGKVDTHFDYSSETKVSTNQGRGAGLDMESETFLTPSVEKDQSLLDVNFFYDDLDFTHPNLSPADVKINMQRNQITVLKYVYNPSDNTFTIYTKVNDTWEAVHDLILD